MVCSNNVCQPHFNMMFMAGDVKLSGALRCGHKLPLTHRWWEPSLILGYRRNLVTVARQWETSFPGGSLSHGDPPCSCRSGEWTATILPFGYFANRDWSPSNQPQHLQAKPMRLTSYNKD